MAFSSPNNLSQQDSCRDPPGDLGLSGPELCLHCCPCSCSDFDSQVQQHAQTQRGNPPRSNLRHHQSFNQPPSSSSPSPASHGQPRAQTPRRTPSVGAQIQVPQIRIALDPGEPLDPGLKQEISQQVRELRAQNRSQRKRSPTAVKEDGQAAPRKEPRNPEKEPSGPVPLRQSRAAADPRDRQKEKSPGRPLSVPNHSDVVTKAPAQVQKLVSALRRCSSYAQPRQ